VANKVFARIPVALEEQNNVLEDHRLGNFAKKRKGEDYPVVLDEAYSGAIDQLHNVLID
jgi:hypothetical protein